MSKNFFFFRHALATHRLDGYGDEIVTAEILPEGKPPVERMASFLKEIPTDLQYVSPLKRCQQTAHIVSSITGKHFVVDGRLTEYRGEVPEESITDLRKRCQDFLRELESTDSRTILICTHGAVIAALYHLLVKKDFTEKDQYDYPATGELWSLRDGQLESFDFNA